ncbi:MAG: prolipoprotein diacylglyceryl transferase [Pseudomonadota bacterium]
MYPVIFQWGKITIASYGTMLVCAFLTCYFLTKYEFKRLNLPEKLVEDLIFFAMIGGIVGSKIYFLFENFKAFLDNPIKMAFSTSGFTAYGGFFLAVMLCIYAIKKAKVKIITVTDAVAPMLAIGYGIGRIGCQLAGDGCYGIPSSLPWAMAYPNGVIPTLQAVHPTPVYETIYGITLFAVLWLLRKKDFKPGRLISIYLIFTGLGRLLVEFIRLNEKVLFGLTGAQVIGIVAIVFGIWGVYKTRKQKVKA